jgi:hypothetical protein
MGCFESQARGILYDTTPFHRQSEIELYFKYTRIYLLESHGVLGDPPKLKTSWIDII